MSALLYGSAAIGGYTLLNNVENLFGVNNSNSSSSNSSSSSGAFGLSTFDIILLAGGFLLVIVLVEK